MREPPKEFESDPKMPSGLPGEALVFAFRERRMLVQWVAEGRATPPSLEQLESSGIAGVRRQFLGRLGGRPVVSSELPATVEPPSDMAFLGLRALFPVLGSGELALAGLAIQIVEWDRDHQFCGRCGEVMGVDARERSKRCPACDLVSYPRLSPAVIVLVERGDEVLLARSPHFPPGMYSTLAGFVEPGESLERTVVREIREEVGVTVGNLRYFGSQPWPFPNSLMIGFRSDWIEGDVAIDEAEIEDAAWFPADALPKIPPRVSIARALIEDYLRERRQSSTT